MPLGVQEPEPILLLFFVYTLVSKDPKGYKLKLKSKLVWLAVWTVS